MVDLDGPAGAGTLLEMDDVAGIGIGEGTGQHHTWLRRAGAPVLQPGRQNIVAGVAPVVVHVGPGGTEELSLVVLQTARGDHRQLQQRRLGALQPDRRDRPRGQAAHPLPPTRQQHGHGHQQRGDEQHRQGASQPGRFAHGGSLGRSSVELLAHERGAVDSRTRRRTGQRLSTGMFTGG